MCRTKRWNYVLQLPFFLWPVIGLSGDGVLEINQACALNTGCFDGDMAGFPVTIDGTAGKSYRLTGDLALSTDEDAIVITSSYVSLDLSGFEIAGPGVCSGTGAKLDCDGSGAGSAIYTTSNPSGVSIRNGTVRNMRFHGIRAEGRGHRIKDITARHNAVSGIATQNQQLVKNCVAMENGLNGIDVAETSIVESSLAMGNGADGIVMSGRGNLVSGSTSRVNGGRGFNLSDGTSKFGSKNVSWANELDDECGGGICTERRRYYLTTAQFDGAGAPDACADGFHMAALYELFDVSDHVYDVQLGFNQGDSGAGPPSGVAGWIRTGSSGATLAEQGIGAFNCNAYTSNNTDHWGSVVSLRYQWQFLEEHYDFDQWGTNGRRCDTTPRVWCIEDH